MYVRGRPVIRIILLAMLVLFLLAACRNQETQLQRDEQVRITCTDSCTRHGQCGILLDQRRVVLANQVGPAVSLHDRFFEEGTVGLVIDINDRELIAARDGVPLIAQSTPFPHKFYQVNAADRTAWVSGWCLTRP